LAKKEQSFSPSHQHRPASILFHVAREVDRNQLGTLKAAAHNGPGPLAAAAGRAHAAG